MINWLILAAIVIFCGVFLNKISYKLGIPSLLIFIGLGMLLGIDGILKIPFTDYGFAEKTCSLALVFIMFYGGFGTNWKLAKPIAGKAIILSSFGVFTTAMFTGLFCHYVLNMEWLLSFIIGSVISSTDAASVFAVLRSRKLNLKYNTASLLEVESGSNDPTAYTLTLVFISLWQSRDGNLNIFHLIISQIGLGIVFGVFIAYLAKWILRNYRFADDGLDMVFIVGIALIAYALPQVLHGNGYLSTYIAGIILGNTSFNSKKKIVHFLDGTTNLLQMLIFFLLGLLSTPRILPTVAVPSIAVALFITLVARPVSVFLLLAPWRGGYRQKMLISLAGLRGASAVVFAIMAMLQTNMSGLIFHATFFIVILSITVQGYLLEPIAKKLDMIDSDNDVMKTFNDYSEETIVNFIEFNLQANHGWIDKKIKEITLPPATLIVLLERDGRHIIPNGDTKLAAGDRIILSALSSGEVSGIVLTEIKITKRSNNIGKNVHELDLPKNSLIILIKRGADVLIPSGNDIIQLDDILVLNHYANLKISE